MRLRAADLAAVEKTSPSMAGWRLPPTRSWPQDTGWSQPRRPGERKAVNLTCLSSFVGQVFLAGTLCVAVPAVLEQAVSLPLAVGLVLVVLALPEVFGQILPGLVRLPRIKLAAAGLCPRCRPCLTRPRSMDRCAAAQTPLKTRCCSLRT